MNNALEDPYAVRYTRVDSDEIAADRAYNTRMHEANLARGAPYMDNMQNVLTVMSAVSNPEARRIAMQSNEDILATNNRLRQQGYNPMVQGATSSEGLLDRDIEELNRTYVPQGVPPISTDRVTEITSYGYGLENNRRAREGLPLIQLVRPYESDLEEDGYPAAGTQVISQIVEEEDDEEELEAERYNTNITNQALGLPYDQSAIDNYIVSPDNVELFVR